MRMIFKVCAGEKGYDGGGCSRDSWWCQEVSEKQIWSTLVEAREAMIRRRKGGGIMKWEP